MRSVISLCGCFPLVYSTTVVLGGDSASYELQEDEERPHLACVVNYTVTIQTTLLLWWTGRRTYGRLPELGTISNTCISNKYLKYFLYFIFCIWNTSNEVFCILVFKILLFQFKVFWKYFLQNTCFKILSSFPHRHTHTTRTGIHKWHRTTVPISLLISPAIATLLCSTLSYKRSCLVLDSQRKCFLFSVDCQCDEMDKTKKLPVILDRKFFTVMKRVASKQNICFAQLKKFCLLLEHWMQRRIFLNICGYVYNFTTVGLRTVVKCRCAGVQTYKMTIKNAEVICRGNG